MLTAQEYRKRTRKTITLPSGGEVVIRKLSVSDFLSAGDVPSAFWEAVKKGDKTYAAEVIASDPALERRITHAALLRGVVSIKIVDKDPRDCAEDEVAVSEMDQEDIRKIMDEVAAMNHLNAEAGKAVSRFREEPGASGDHRHDGDEVRQTPDRDSVAGRG